jgi:predicted lactoylglutathione lyase
MSTRIFVNLPVEHLDHPVAFFTQLGSRFDPRFADATCMTTRFADPAGAIIAAPLDEQSP